MRVALLVTVVLCFTLVSAGVVWGHSQAPNPDPSLTSSVAKWAHFRDDKSVGWTAWGKGPDAAPSDDLPTLACRYVYPGHLVYDFGSTVNLIRVFPYIENVTSLPDGSPYEPNGENFEYIIEASNDVDAANWTLIYQPTATSNLHAVPGQQMHTWDVAYVGAGTVVNRYVDGWHAALTDNEVMDLGLAGSYRYIRVKSSNINYGSNDAEIDAIGTPVPEPSSIALLAMGAVGLVPALRRRRARRA